MEEKIKALKKRIDKLDADRNILETHWAQDVKEASSDPKFDPYSKKGEKILRKVADRYTPMFIEIDDEREELVDKYNALVDKYNKTKKVD